ncbi:MAG: hypothetical protein SFW09_07830 [Hyphomicrobiaceae bacterium]|nr:hypothetical protein [Hyphomicrobiaceae bacterium]
MARALRDTPWPVLLLLASFLCPNELSVYVGSVRLPPHRALLLILLPLALIRLLGSGGSRIMAFDYAMLGFGGWTMVSYLVHHGMADGLQPGGAMTLDSFASFLVARAYVPDQRRFEATAGMLFLAVMIAGLVALPEMLTGQFYIHALMAQLTGHVHPTGVETRLGLTRAFGTFDHPIHLGTFCAAGLALSVYTARGATSWVRGLVIPASALTGLSSAPMLSIAVQSGLILAERATRGIKSRVPIGASLITGLFLVASLIATRSPFAVIATGFTLDSWTGYYRLLIWENGLANVWANPLFGIGLNDWERPQWMASPTVDAFWLVIAMRNGIPAFLLLVLVVFLLVRGVGGAVRLRDEQVQQHAKGWIISLVALVLVGCTVHYWNVPYAFFFFFLGMGACFSSAARAPQTARVQAKGERQDSRLQWLAPAPAYASAMATVPPWADGPPAWPVPVVAPKGGSGPASLHGKLSRRSIVSG